MKFGFSSEAHLKSPRQFDLVFRTGRRQTGELVRLLFLEKREGQTKFGVTVSKKIANAVKRVRGRRILRESLRRLRPWTKQGCWIVVSMRDTALQRSAKDVYFDVARLMQNAGLMRDDWQGADWNADSKDEA